MTLPSRALHHRWQDGLAAEEGAAHVHGHHPFPCLQRRLQEGGVGTYACVVHQYVDVAELVQGCLGHGADAFLVTHVAGNGEGLPTRGLYFFGYAVDGAGQLAPGRFSATRDNNVATSPGQAQSYGAADTTGCPCHYGYLSRKLQACWSP